MGGRDGRPEAAGGFGPLGYAYENSWGADIDLDKARVAYGKQCAIDSAGCQGVSEPCSVTNRICPIHGVAMLEDRVPLGSGLGSGEHSLDEKEGEVAAIKRTHSA